MSEGEREISRPISRAGACSSVFAEKIRKYGHVSSARVKFAMFVFAVLDKIFRSKPCKLIDIPLGRALWFTNTWGGTWYRPCIYDVLAEFYTLSRRQTSHLCLSFSANCNFRNTFNPLCKLFLNVNMKSRRLISMKCILHVYPSLSRTVRRRSLLNIQWHRAKFSMTSNVRLLLIKYRWTNIDTELRFKTL